MAKGNKCLSPMFPIDHNIQQLTWTAIQSSRSARLSQIRAEHLRALSLSLILQNAYVCCITTKCRNCTLFPPILWATRCPTYCLPRQSGPPFLLRRERHVTINISNTIPGMFTGYSASSKAYMIYLGGGVWRESRDVVFLENIRGAHQVGLGVLGSQQQQVGCSGTIPHVVRTPFP
jgi:hypothetical protein